jgi:recombinational DNA repair ATPase RecF
MDDVLSELDRRRQQAVQRLAAVGGQTLLTVTSLDAIDHDLLPAPVVEVRAGTLIMA